MLSGSSYVHSGRQLRIGQTGSEVQFGSASSRKLINSESTGWPLKWDQHWTNFLRISKTWTNNLYIWDILASTCIECPEFESIFQIFGTTKPVIFLKCPESEPIFHLLGTTWPRPFQNVQNLDQYSAYLRQPSLAISRVSQNGTDISESHVCANLPIPFLECPTFGRIFRSFCVKVASRILEQRSKVLEQCSRIMESPKSSRIDATY